jgi:hypothetical protein
MTGATDELRVTYVGWQGWVFTSRNTRIAIDALFVDSVGRGPLETRVEFPFPRTRSFRWPMFPTLHAYILTHEHEDHFNIPTLARLDRQIPILLSARSSVAAFTILDEMGFSVTAVEPGATIPIGDLELSFFGPGEGTLSDEWDTLAFAVRRPGAGTFFTPVDIFVTDKMKSHVNAIQDGNARDILTFANMALSVWSPAVASADPSSSHEAQSAATSVYGEPERALALLAEGRLVMPHPGMTVTMSGERIRTVDDRTDYLESQDWRKARPFQKGDDEEVSAPVTGMRPLTDEDRGELDRWLQELAEMLYGGKTYSTLLSLDATELQGLAPTFVLILLHGDGDEMLIYEYQMRACRFALLEEPPADIEDSYAGALLMWAVDFLALARGEIEPRTLGLALEETWVTKCSLWQELWHCYHPLRFPQRVLGQYRRVLVAEAAMQVLVKAANRSPGP